MDGRGDGRTAMIRLGSIWVLEECMMRARMVGGKQRSGVSEDSGTHRKILKGNCNRLLGGGGNQ